MTDRNKICTSSVRATRTSGASPDKRRKYNEVFNTGVASGQREPLDTAAWHQPQAAAPLITTQLMAQVGSVEVARDPKARSLRTTNKQGPKELGKLKRPWSSSASLPHEHLSTHRAASRQDAGTSAVPSIPGGPGRLLRLVPPPAGAVRCRWANRPGKSRYMGRLTITTSVMVPAGCKWSASRRPRRGPLAHPLGAPRKWPARSATAFVCAPHHRLRPGRARCDQPGVGRGYHLLALLGTTPSGRQRYLAV